MSCAETLTENDYNQICDMVYKHSRIHLGSNKRELVAARLGKRLRATGLKEYRDYCLLLKSPDGTTEIGNLVDVISTNHTFFFRESKHFEFLNETVYPSFRNDPWGKNHSSLRCWSAACSSGEEPYSIAISLSMLAEKQTGFLWEIEASDICTNVIEAARAGVYAEPRLGGITMEQKRRYFQIGRGGHEGKFRVKEEIRKRVRWHHLNLFQDRYPFKDPFHVIFCRNVMIYFDRPSQEQLILSLTRQLAPGGYLMIGHSESLTGIKHTLDPIGPAIYRKAQR